MIRLNSITDDILAARHTDDMTIKVNGEELSRRKIVSAGTLVATEYMGSILNRRVNTQEKFNSRIEAKGENYADISKAHAKQLVTFCAAVADRVIGKEPTATYEQIVTNRQYFRNEMFLATLAAITQDIVTPILPRFFSDLSGDLMQIHDIAPGATYELNIRSNDIFVFEDSAIGAGHSATYQYLYGDTITMRAKSYTAQTKINWYQQVVNGDVGEYYTAFAQGMWNKVYAIFMEYLKSAAGNTTYIPAALVYQGYNSTNWANLIQKVAAVNNVRISDLVAYGTLANLSSILPVDGAGAAVVGLQYGLGERWFERGYLPNAWGVQLIPSQPVIVPYTQNSTIDTIDLDDNLYVFAKGGNGYAPIQAVMEAGSPLTVTLTADKTADFTIDTNVEARFNAMPVFASKAGILQFA